MGFLRKLAGLFVERVPVDEQGRPVKPVPGPRGAPAPALPQSQPAPPAHGRPPQPPYPGQQQPQPVQQPYPPGAQPGFGTPMVAGATSPVQPMPVAPGAQQPGQAQPYASSTVAIALRAVVPQEYAAHLAPHGLHVIAAGPDITSEQARGWGAQVLVVSAECLGQDLHLLQHPQLATVFVAPQAVMLPAHPGVVQVQEPLHASDVAHAVREAAGGWAATAPPTHG